MSYRIMAMYYLYYLYYCIIQDNTTRQDNAGQSEDSVDGSGVDADKTGTVQAQVEPGSCKQSSVGGCLGLIPRYLPRHGVGSAQRTERTTNTELYQR